MAKNPEHRDLFPGALEVMILQSLRLKPMHGYALVKHIKQVSENLLQVEEGSLYPALQRLLKEGLLKAQAGTSAKAADPRGFIGSSRRSIRHLESRSCQLRKDVCGPFTECFPPRRPRRRRMSRLGDFFSRNQRYEDISVSIEEHVDERTEELMEEGMPHDEAARAARREVRQCDSLAGSVAARCGSGRGVEALLADLKHVGRRLGAFAGIHDQP